MNHVELLPSNRRDVVIKQVFDTLDMSETTRREYAVRIRHFLRFTDTHGLRGSRDTYTVWRVTGTPTREASKVFVRSENKSDVFIET